MLLWSFQRDEGFETKTVIKKNGEETENKKNTPKYREKKKNLNSLLHNVSSFETVLCYFVLIFCSGCLVEQFFFHFYYHFH